MKSSLFVVFSCLVLTGTLWGQAISVAQITGTVKDQSGALLPGVEVRVTHGETGYTRTVITDETGAYILPNLPVGPYKLEAMLTGFTTSNLHSGLVSSGGRGLRTSHVASNVCASTPLTPRLLTTARSDLSTTTA